MSKYYNINGLKVRVSDHEPNDTMNFQRGRNDIELYIKSADNRTLSVQSQLERICDRRELDINDFQEVTNDWIDGQYTKDFFAPKIDEEEEVVEPSNHNDIWELRLSYEKQLEAKIAGFTFHGEGAVLRAQIKEVSQLTGVGQNFIKEHYGLRSRASGR
jgi:hypothetical protein